MNKRFFRITHPLLALVILAAMFGFSSPAKAASNNLWAWGNNSVGQLGREPALYVTEPVRSGELTGVKAVEATRISSSVLKLDGTVWSFGSNSFGLLADGATVFLNNNPTPVQSKITGVAAIAAGLNHNLALKSDGSVWAWGSGGNGQRGDNNTLLTASTPVQVIGLTGMSGIAGGTTHSLAVKSDGTVWAWGDNSLGQLGDGTSTNRLAPVQVSGLTGVVALAAGYTHSLALKSDGTVWAWGLNLGQLGDGTTADKSTPVQVRGLTGVVALTGGEGHSLALKSDGTVWAWGQNSYGQLGDGTAIDRLTPVQVNGLTGVTAIDAGHYHSLAVKSDGTVWAWGDNTNGQLGNSAVQNSAIPVQVAGLSGVAAIAAGRFHSLALLPPDTPSLVGASPPDAAINVTTDAKISWGAVLPYNFDFQLSTSANFTTLTANVTNSSNNTYTPTTALATNTTYYWRVRTRAITLTSQWVTGKFTTVLPNVAPPPPPPSVTPTYKITASAGANGAILPPGGVSVNAGASHTCEIVPNTGFRVDDVMVDGVSVGAVTSYTFSGVTANHIITASFAEVTRSLTPWIIGGIVVLVLIAGFIAVRFKTIGL